MPRISGRELASRVREIRPDARVLFMSGYADEAVARQGTLEAGSAFIEKPFSANDLARSVREVLDRPIRALA
jgi:FixJ family two-component response regulator